jgi:hypothetical protein
LLFFDLAEAAVEIEKISASSVIIAGETFLIELILTLLN